MSRSIDVGDVGQLADGTMKAIEVEGRELLLARVGDTYYAADERCPHMNGHLSRGRLQGTILACPVHGSRFDLADGRVTRWTEATGLVLTLAKKLRAPRELKTYPVRSRDGRLLVEIE